MAEKQSKTRTATEPKSVPYPYEVAILTRPDGPYGAGQAVTVDPGAPWTKGNPPTFQDDDDRVREWRDIGSPLFVDHGRFNAWKRDGFFGDRKGAEK